MSNTNKANEAKIRPLLPGARQSRVQRADGAGEYQAGAVSVGADKID